MHTFARKLMAAAAVAAATLMVTLPAGAAVEVKGVKFNDTYQLGGQTLQLNGAGARVKIIVDVYAAALYVPKREHAAAAVLGQGGPKSLHLVLLRELTGEEFADALVKGFKKNNSDADFARFQPQLEELRNLMLTFGAVKKGTTIRLDSTPGAGTRVFVEGAQKGAPLPGDEFFGALLRIWLGASPVDGDLKEALLGAQ